MNLKIQEFQLPPEQIWAFDETAVWSGAASLRTMVQPGCHDSTVLIKGDMSRDTLIIAANQAGETYHHFIEHTDSNPNAEESEYSRKRIRGAGVQEIKNFVEDFTEKYRDGGIIIQDNLNSHHKPKSNNCE
jgi:hypothetical protein